VWVAFYDVDVELTNMGCVGGSSRAPRLGPYPRLGGARSRVRVVMATKGSYWR